MDPIQNNTANSFYILYIRKKTKDRFKKIKKNQNVRAKKKKSQKKKKEKVHSSQQQQQLMKSRYITSEQNETK